MRFQTFYDPVGLYFMSPLDLHEERLDSLPAPSSFSSSYAPLNSLQFSMPNFSRPPLNKYFHLHGNSPFTPLLPLPVPASAAVGVASAPRSFPIKLKSFPSHFHATHPLSPPPSSQSRSMCVMMMMEMMLLLLVCACRIYPGAKTPTL